MNNRSRTASMALVALLACSSFSCAMRRHRLNEALSKQKMGVAKLNEGNANGAVADLTESWELNDSDAETAHLLGMAWWAKGRSLGDTEMIVEGEKYILKALDMENNPEWRNNLGALYIDLGRFDDTIKYCQSALKDPAYRTPDRALNNMGKAYIQQGQFAKALEPLDRALNIQPRSCQALWNKGEALKSLKRWEDAKKSLVRVNEICPNWPEPYLLLAQVLYFGKRDKQGAVQALEKVQALQSSGPIRAEADELLRQIPR